MRSSDSLHEEAMNRDNDARSPERAGEDRYRREQTPAHLRAPKRERVWIPDHDKDSDDPK